jgi:hypothetical protein
MVQPFYVFSFLYTHRVTEEEGNVQTMCKETLLMLLGAAALRKAQMF